MGYTSTIPIMTEPIKSHYKLIVNRNLVIKGFVMKDKMGLNKIYKVERLLLSILAIFLNDVSDIWAKYPLTNSLDLGVI